MTPRGASLLHYFFIFPDHSHTNVVCFESPLMCRIGLPPSKFLVSILNYLGCESVHLYPNAIAALSYFMMLSECWLDIQPHTSLLWYFYSSARYEHKVFSNIELMPRHNYRGEYRNVIIRGCWKGSSRRWFHVNLGTAPQWPNKHLLPPLINDM
jgi:hypothetical protein